MIATYTQNRTVRIFGTGGPTFFPLFLFPFDITRNGKLERVQYIPVKP